MLALRLAQLFEGVSMTKRIPGSKIRAVILVWWVFHSSFSRASHLCTFDQEYYNNKGERAFNHLAQEHIDKNAKDNVKTYKYQLKIYVENTTSCGVRLRHVADEPKNTTELTQPAECQEFLDPRNSTSYLPRRGPKCLNEWFINDHKSYVTVSYITNNRSILPDPGRYEVTLQNGEMALFRPRPNASMNYKMTFS